ncbi:hypothetical protein E2C01_000639 [Portunus trituberculatus]|uniref:Uncharacterized protein n=1 Tax=Portunus trituberculatus TaxID=210409 RepID=A0A5B7CFQ1_PORTR|nr:hypothetical protein [Portunus trituberculatus]
MIQQDAAVRSPALPVCEGRELQKQVIDTRRHSFTSFLPDCPGGTDGRIPRPRNVKVRMYREETGVLGKLQGGEGGKYLTQQPLGKTRPHEKKKKKQQAENPLCFCCHCC